MNSIRHPRGRSASIAFALAVSAAAAQAQVNVPRPLKVYGYGEIDASAVSPAGDYILLVAASNAHLRNVQTGEYSHTFAGHTGRVRNAAFSPGGRRALTVSADGTAKLWHTVSGALLLTLTGHVGNVFDGDFSPDGTQLFTAGADGEARIWDATTGGLLAVLNHGSPLNTLAVSPDGQRLATGAADGTVKVWPLATRGEPLTFTGHDSACRGVVFSPSGEEIVSCAGSAIRWNSVTGAELDTFSVEGAIIASADYSPDGMVIATAGWSDGKFGQDALSLWSAADGSLIRQVWARPPVSFTVDGLTVLSRDELWDWQTGTVVANFSGPTAFLRAGDLSADGTRIAMSRFGSVVVFDVQSAQPVLHLSELEGLIPAVSFSPDGTRIVAGDSSQRAALWDAATGTFERYFTGHTNWVYSVAMTHDAAMVLTGSNDNTARLWDADDGSLIRTFSGSTGTVLSLDVSPDDTRVIMGSGSPFFQATIRNISTGAVVRTLPHASAVWTARYSTDGTRVVTASSDGTAKLWNASTGALVATFTPGWQVYTAALSPDNSQIVLGTANFANGHVSLMDVATQTTLRQFQGHRDSIAAAEFLPDGTALISISEDGTARLWSTGDCNTNGIDDLTDVAAGTSLDCNQNGHPDGCEPDTDQDGVIDGCDQCPGTPTSVSVDSVGCPPYRFGDFTRDGETNLADYQFLAGCLNGPQQPPRPGGGASVVTCLEAFDADADQDVDLSDFAVFVIESSQPD